MNTRDYMDVSGARVHTDTYCLFCPSMFQGRNVLKSSKKGNGLASIPTSALKNEYKLTTGGSCTPHGVGNGI